MQKVFSDKKEMLSNGLTKRKNQKELGKNWVSKRKGLPLGIKEGKEKEIKKIQGQIGD